MVLGSIFFFSQPTTATSPPAVPTPAFSAATITVHVSGAVQQAGLVEVVASARVADVVAAAGGTTAGANLQSVNLAAHVRDGEQIVIPDASSPAAPSGDGTVRLNTASQAELESIAGIGPVLAARIIAARDERGGFTAVEDLLDVSGIGEAKLASFRDVVTVP